MYIKEKCRWGIMLNILEKSWMEISPIWEEIYKNNENASAFQTYAFLDFTGRGKAYRKDLFRLVGVKERNFVLYDDDKPLAIAPMLVKRKKDRNFVYLKGHFTAANDLDFIHQGWSYEEFRFMMDGIRNHISNAYFFIDRIYEKSVTCTHLKKYMAKAHPNICVYISVPQSYEDWYLTLSKSVRANTIKYKNRMQKDVVQWTAHYITGKPVDKQTSKKMMRILSQRLLVKNHFHLGIFSSLAARFIQAALERDQLTKWLKIAPENIHVLLYMNNELAAFISGLVCRGGQISLSQIAMDARFARYQPGGLLFSCLIKYLTEQKNNGGIAVNRLELGGGNAPYKYQFGGQTQYYYTFTDE